MYVQTFWGNLFWCHQFWQCRILTVLVAFAWMCWVLVFILVFVSTMFAVANAAFFHPLHGRYDARDSYFRESALPSFEAMLMNIAPVR